MHANPNNPTATNGTDQAWGGNRARPDLVKKFFPNGNVPNLESYATAEAAGDDRALFSGVNRTLDNEDVSTFKSGFACWLSLPTSRQTVAQVMMLHSQMQTSS